MHLGVLGERRLRRRPRGGARPPRPPQPSAGHGSAGSSISSPQFGQRPPRRSNRGLEQQRLDAALVQRRERVVRRRRRRGRRRRCRASRRSSASRSARFSSSATSFATAPRICSSVALDRSIVDPVRAPGAAAHRRRACASNRGTISGWTADREAVEALGAPAPVDGRGDAPQVVVDVLLDAALVVRLRPAALVVLAADERPRAARSSRRPSAGPPSTPGRRGG